MYYPLHVHTEVGSIGDSMLRIPQYVQRAHEYGLDSLAITDHGTLNAMFMFADECKKYNIKPIIGMEAYEVEDANQKDKEHRYDYNHLVLLAKNNEGLKNLLIIHNDAQSRGFYGKPRTDVKTLQEHGQGIIALSACVAGTIPQAILNDNIELAIEKIQFYQSCFDEFFLEIQPGNFEQQLRVNDTLISLAQRIKVPVVVTNDIHYLNAEDYQVHDYHVKLGRKKDKEKFDDDLVYPDTCYWFMNEEQLKENFTYTDIITPSILHVALLNAQYIANMCNVDLRTQTQIPKFCDNEEEVLEKLCIDKLNQLPQNNPAYKDRLEYELSVIKQKKFCGYFLIVNDFVQWARKHKLHISYARGSGGGSLVTYLLGITAPDPIYYDLFFERFLDPKREATPDIDIDISSEDREKLFQYIINKYGQDHCAQISTIHVRKARGAIKDAGRILNIPLNHCEVISKLIPMVFYDDEGEKQTDLSIQESLEIEPELIPWKNKYPELFSLAMQLEGLSSSMGIHAAGIGIGPYPLTNMIPLIKSKREELPATSLTLNDAEKFMIKMDLLGLDTIDIIKKTEDELHIHFDITDPTNFNDPKVWSMIGSSNTVGIFQLSSSTYRRRMGRLKPKTIQELAACLALIRGPCISAKTDELYMNIVQGKEKIKKIHPIYDKVTESTNGILLYQEQIMQLTAAIGIDLSTGYRMIKAAAKKKHEEMEHYRDLFMTAIQKRGCPQDTAEYIFNLILDSTKYSFNLSHAISYSLLGYHSAWLKTYYTVHYMKNLLTNKYINSPKEVSATVNNCKANKIEFLLPDINKSDWECTVEDNKIRLGFCSIKGLGEKAAMHVLERRMFLGPFTSIEHFLNSIEKKSFNKSKVLVSIFAGVFDSVENKTHKEQYKEYCEKQNLEVQTTINVAKDYTINTSSELSISMQKLIYGADLVR